MRWREALISLFPPVPGMAERCAAPSHCSWLQPSTVSGLRREVGEWRPLPCGLGPKPSWLGWPALQRALVPPSPGQHGNCAALSHDTWLQLSTGLGTRGGRLGEQSPLLHGPSQLYWLCPQLLCFHTRPPYLEAADCWLQPATVVWSQTLSTALQTGDRDGGWGGEGAELLTMWTQPGTPWS